MPVLSRKEAKELGLELHRLLTWDGELGNPRRLQVGEVVVNLVYSLDEFQLSTKVHKRTLDNVPPETLTCGEIGLPLRPMYVDLNDGRTKRAIPISWNEGVDYVEWKSRKEKS